MERVKREIGEVWKVKEGSKTSWCIKGPGAIMDCKTKREALLWQEQIRKNILNQK